MTLPDTLLASPLARSIARSTWWAFAVVAVAGCALGGGEPPDAGAPDTSIQVDAELPGDDARVAPVESCRVGAVRGCGSDVGACRAGTQTCFEGAWGACEGESPPVAETCGTGDADCDGRIGCDDDDCHGAPCAADPPAPVCVDAWTLRTFRGEGVCADGGCALESLDTPCAGGCERGACLACVDEPWQLTTVDAAGDTGRFPDIAVDAVGVVHVAYGDVDTLSLRYARRDASGAWSMETAHTEGSSSPTIAVDAFGTAHLFGHSYMHAGDLYAARRRDGSWVRANLEPTRSLQLDAAIDPAGDVAYAHVRGTALGISRATGATWITEPVPTPAPRPTLPTVAFDASGGLHVAYRDQDAQDLWYSHRDASGEWTHEHVVGGEPRVNMPTLALDRGSPVVAYTEQAAGEVRFVRRDARGAWVDERVEAGASASPGHRTAIAADRLGGLHFVYHSPASSRLRYARRAPDGVWSRRDLDASGSTGLTPSVTVAPDLRVHVAYWIGATRDLGYATARFCP